MKWNILGWLPQNDQHRTLAKSWVWCPPVKHWAQGWAAAQPARGCCVTMTTGWEASQHREGLHSLAPHSPHSQPANYFQLLIAA